MKENTGGSCNGVRDSEGAALISDSVMSDHSVNCAGSRGAIFQARCCCS